MPNQYLTADEFRHKKFFSMPNRQYDDTVLDEYLQIASANVEAYCERIFASTAYTEKFVGDGSLTYIGYQYPLITATSLQEVTLSAAPITTNADVTKRLATSANDAINRYELTGLDLAGVTVFRTDALYTYVYTAGYATIPPVVKHATGLWTAELLRGDYGATQQSPEVVPLTSQQIVELLNPIRRRRIG